MRKHIQEAVEAAKADVGPAPEWPEYEDIGSRTVWYVTPHEHPTWVELYLTPSSAFTQKGWGDAIREIGGSFKPIAQMDTYRMVTVPYNKDTRPLIHALCVEFRARALAFRTGGRTGFVVAGSVVGGRRNDPSPSLLDLEAKYVDALVFCVRQGQLAIVDTSTPQKAHERKLLLAWREHKAAEAQRASTRRFIADAAAELHQREKYLAEQESILDATAEAAAEWERLIEAERERLDAQDALKRSL